MLHFLSSLAAATALFFGQAASNGPATKDDAGRRTAYLAAFNAQDAEAVTKLYAADAAFLPFTGQLISGGAIIGPAITRLAARVTLELTPSSASASEGLWFEAGTWRHIDRASGGSVDGGTYLWVWRKDTDGAWRIAAHSVTHKPQ